MTSDADRMARAGNYVLGLMDPAERERAELDLERDAAFRDAVLRIAERLRLVGASPNEAADMRWSAISAKIAELPQMRGKKFSESGKPVPQPPAPHARKTVGVGLHSMPVWRGIFVAVGLIAAFVLGYVIGVSALVPGAAKHGTTSGESTHTP